MNTDKKEHALNQIAELALLHDISLDEIGAKLTQNSVREKGGKWLTYLLGYLGAAFIFGGLGLFISMIWDDIGSAARVIITYGPGIIAFIMGFLVLRDERFVKAATSLFIKSAILLPVGMFTFLHEYADGDDTQLAAMIIFGLLAFQFLSAFFHLKQTILLFFGFLFWNGALGIFMDRSGVPGEWLGIGLGVSIMVVAYFLDKTPHRSIAAFWYFIGSIGLFWSVFDLVQNIELVDTLICLPLTVSLMYLSVSVHSRTLLITSTLALLGFLGYFTDEYFADVTGWPVALIILGFLMIGISSYAVKLGRNITSA